MLILVRAFAGRKYHSMGNLILLLILSFNPKNASKMALFIINISIEVNSLDPDQGFLIRWSDHRSSLILIYSVDEASKTV